MKDPNAFSPEALRRTNRIGMVAALAAIVWSGTITAFGSEMSRGAFWTTFVCVNVLIIAVPCWFAGRAAKRDYLAGNDLAA